MRKHGIAPNDANVIFGQVYGFVDSMSYALGRHGYTVYKSTPYGSVDEWLPYLSRRAAESHSAFLTARTDLPDYRYELLRRFKLRR
jgi:hypothetical protein